ncbi:MAG: hypothetical protein J7497_06770 [Chitinophagaceae bacterium]|nr:hypothetical protein [Chitinophagaceae bacterium]
MLKEINSITRQYFQKENLEALTVEELQQFIDEYPYSSVARFLLAKKSMDNDVLTTSGLYFNNPLRLEWLLENSEADYDNEEPAPEIRNHEEPVVEEKVPETVVATDAPNTEPEPIVFQSYHTIDYFASQGIRLQQTDLSKDKFGQQLKSFTEWLRSMKRLPTAETIQNQHVDMNVARNAATSIEEKEVMTEAMAEVWAKQGNREKALAIYTKLSLQNPDKSAYFAAKIDQLK